MFGYIAPDFNLLNDEQKDRYRQYYCGLCRELKRQSGQAGRLLLSNDLTFLSVLLISLGSADPQTETFRCPLHPLQPRHGISSGINRYVADMNLLLMYYKCVDARSDDRSLSGKAGIRYLQDIFCRIKSEYPRQAEQVRSALEEIWSLERAGSDNIDRLCNLSGRMLGSVFVRDEGNWWASALYTVGHSLGRFVWFMDAFDDLPKDIRAGHFNPLRSIMDRPDYESFCKDTLEMLISDAAETIDLLPLTDNLDILQNVVYSGVWQRYNRLQSSKKKEAPDDK